MRVLAAPDKFKGTLTASEAAASISAGWQRGAPGSDVDAVPIADGGEGTLEALVDALAGEIKRTSVTGPLGDRVEADYGVVPGGGGSLAIVEMARASGLALVPPEGTDPRVTSTYGTGELIRAACRHRVDRLVVCVGGSATNDAGAGMAQALGIRLMDQEGLDLPPGGAALRRLARIDAAGLESAVREVEILAAVDVDNPLAGPQGASAVYGPQKGASPQDVSLLDQALGHFAAIVHRDLGIDLHAVPGAGAAGGLGGGLVAFLGARLRPGFDVVADALELGRRIDEADVVVTGEGRFDSQSLRGKAAAAMLRLAAESGRPTVLVAGGIEAGVAPPADLVFDLTDRFGRDAALERTRELVEQVAQEAASLVGAGRDH